MPELMDSVDDLMELLDMPPCVVQRMWWRERRFQVHIMCKSGDLPVTLHPNILKFAINLQDEAFCCKNLELMDRYISGGWF